MRTRTILFTLGAAIASALVAVSCHKIDETRFKELSPITFSEVPDVINVSLGQVLIYDRLEVKSALPVTYQWAFGKKKTSSGAGQWDMDSMEIISTDPRINYLFTKLGTYILRLRVDNGEDIAYKYFTLNVNSGLDEGLLILSDAEGGKSELTFIKKRTNEEVSENAREIWEDLFGMINPDHELKRGTSLFLSAFSTGGISYNHLLLSTDDDHGTIYDIEPKTMTVITGTPMKDQFGTWCCDFSGRQTAGTGAYTFLRAGDGRVFRHDLFTAFLTERTDVMLTAGAVEKSKDILYSTSAGTTYCKSLFYTDGFICQPDNNGTTIYRKMPDGWKIVNICSDRDANKTYLLLRSDSDASSYRIMSTSGSLNSLQDVSEFTASSLNMDGNSVFCTSLNSNDAYYSFGGKVYRWGMTGAPAGNAAITLPDGEQICDMATNFTNSVVSGSETFLYIATYNPERQGLKGSVFVYDIATDSLVKSYEGVTGKPVKMLYKYRIS
ncbi:MAG: hypothetical protein IJM35_05650 [Bacteroidales bacterium]|nr:hypothetical protein [Bacteroidales bacterium]